MKKVFLILSLFVFLGVSSTNVYADNEKVKTENVDNEKCKCGKDKSECKGDCKAMTKEAKTKDHNCKSKCQGSKDPKCCSKKSKTTEGTKTKCCSKKHKAVKE